MSTKLVLLATPGVGENIQMLPALHQWLSVAGEDSATFVLPVAQAHSGLFNVKGVEPTAYDLRWKPNGTVILDEGLRQQLARFGFDKHPVEFASRQPIELDVRTHMPDWRIRARLSGFGHVPVVTGNSMMLTGVDAFDHTIKLALPKVGKGVRITVCSGSFEPMRSIPPPAFVRLLAALTSELRLRKKEMNLVLTNDRYTAAIDMMAKNLNPYINEVSFDEKTGDSLAKAARLIHSADMIVTPDSGTAHIALASVMERGTKKGMIFLPTREPAEQVFSKTQREWMHEWTMSKPLCDEGCRGRLGAAASVPKDYPWSLACSHEMSVPCLRLEPGDAISLAMLARSLGV